MLGDVHAYMRSPLKLTLAAKNEKIDLTFWLVVNRDD